MTIYFTWLLSCLIIALITRLFQYLKPYGALFVIGHALVDVLVLYNPLAHLVSWFSVEPNSLLCFGFTIVIYFVSKYFFLKKKRLNTKELTSFLALDLILIIGCLLLQDSFGFVQKLVETQ